MACPLVDRDPADEEGETRFNKPSSPTASFQAFRPPISSIGGLFSGRWNSFSNIERESADIGELTEPRLVELSSYIIIRSNLERFLKRICSVGGDIT
jgi:hypothetical protein